MLNLLKELDALVWGPPLLILLVWYRDLLDSSLRTLTDPASPKGLPAYFYQG